MSSAVHSLQKAILEGKKSLTQMLRETKLIAAKLSLSDVEQWVDFELNGYPDDAKPPDYRLFSAHQVQIRNPIRGWEFAGHCQVRVRAHEPIAEIENLSTAEFLQIPLRKNYAVRDSLGGVLGSDWPQRIVMPASEYKHILEAVKNALLQWSIQLEKNGIKGEDMHFDEKEKQSVANQVFNIGTVHGIVGNATNSQVNIRIAGSYNELNVQVGAIRAVEAALAAEIAQRKPDGEVLTRAGEAEKALRKVREELEDEKKPDPNRVLKWLEQAKYALKAFGLTKEIIDAGQKLEEASER